MKYCLFLGRFQPCHLGHEWLFNQQLEKGKALLILVRDVEPDEKNPLTAQQVKQILEKRYEDENVVVMIVPDVESVNYGRGVGYEVIEHSPPDNIKSISATEIRNKINNKDESWKIYVNEKIHDLVEKLLNDGQ